MIYYKIENNELLRINSIPVLNPENHIFALSNEEFENSDFYRNCVHHKNGYSRYSKFEVYPDYVYASVAIPNKLNINEYNRVNLYIKDSNLIFVDNRDYILTIADKIITSSNTDMSMSKFIYCFFNLIIENDLIFIEKLEQQLSDIEETLIKGNLDNFSTSISLPKNKLFTFYRYYNYLLNIGESFSSLDNIFSAVCEKKLIKLFVTKVERLKSEMGYLKEYVLQIQGIYQAQVESKQNDIMKVLTVITTIFLPLSLITSWYGMNFQYMPELQWKWGYTFVGVISAVIVLGALYIFKKKKYW